MKTSNEKQRLGLEPMPIIENKKENIIFKLNSEKMPRAKPIIIDCCVYL